MRQSAIEPVHAVSAHALDQQFLVEFQQFQQFQQPFQFIEQLFVQLVLQFKRFPVRFAVDAIDAVAAGRQPDAILTQFGCRGATQ